MAEPSIASAPTTAPGFLERLRNAGIDPGDSEALRLNKSLLAFATGLLSIVSTLWLAIYWLLGPQVSTTAPVLYALLLGGNMLLYVKTRNFDFYRVTQLALFLFAPFAVQWSMGNFITASGVILWGLLAPVGAILFFGVRESAAWFFAWVFMTGLSGLVDYLLLDGTGEQPLAVPVRTSIVFFALNFIAVATILYLMLRFSIREKEKAQARLQQAHQLLKGEQERSERLLLNIMPQPVAQRLKDSSAIIADGIADATVMFADIVNFTQMAEGMSPNQVFTMLNGIFSALDDLAVHFKLEKIKTIGDAYMVAGGISEQAADYTVAIADMALEMRELVRRDFSIDAIQLDLRIGIATGPVVAGVLGKNKFIYDLWGDTVNIAARVTSESRPGVIQCDKTTYLRLNRRFEFSAEEQIELKGKGKIPVYRLLAKKQTAVTAPEAAGGKA